MFGLAHVYVSVIVVVSIRIEGFSHCNDQVFASKVQAACVITSYSIHYTKLYDVRGRLDDDLVLVVVLQAERVVAVTPVITSYSIHYTKLYDIAAIQDHEALAVYFASAGRRGYPVPVNIGQVADFKNPNYYMIYAWQSGLGLPDREYS